MTATLAPSTLRRGLVASWRVLGRPGWRLLVAWWAQVRADFAFEDPVSGPELPARLPAGNPPSTVRHPPAAPTTPDSENRR